jgi:hypothetical protein
MTDAEWTAEIDDPYAMLNYLDHGVTSRKARLFACACFRHKEPKLKRWERKVVELAECYADGRAVKTELQQAQEESVGKSGVAWVTMVTDCWTAVEAARAAGEWRDEPFQCTLVRDIFGNPFRPSPPLPAAVLAWNDGTVKRIAEGIYEERAFDRLPILADALLDAGCDDDELMGHCRSEGPHVRGCWAVDLLLGKS